MGRELEQIICSIKNLVHFIGKDALMGNENTTSLSYDYSLNFICEHALLCFNIVADEKYITRNKFALSSSVLIILSPLSCIYMAHSITVRYGEITSHIAERKTNAVVYSLVKHDQVCITLKMRKSCLSFSLNTKTRYGGLLLSLEICQRFYEKTFQLNRFFNKNVKQKIINT